MTREARSGGISSLEKALELCEALAGAQGPLSVSDLSRATGIPASTVHRLLAVLRRRGYVRQDDETSRYSLTLRMLDLSFRMLGRSELRLHAFPVLREFALRTPVRTFVAVPAAGEVTYLWCGPEGIATYTVYGREMPGHCAMYFDERQVTRRLNCRRLVQQDGGEGPERIVRLGRPAGPRASRLNCACAPVFDYGGREVARVGVFSHGEDDRPLEGPYTRAARELARQVSLRLGHLPVSMAASGH